MPRAELEVLLDDLARRIDQEHTAADPRRWALLLASAAQVPPGTGGG